MAVVCFLIGHRPGAIKRVLGQNVRSCERCHRTLTSSDTTRAI
jgi:hypothetical protein